MTDFHMTVSSDTTMNCVGGRLGAGMTKNGGAEMPATVEGNNSTMVSFKWNVATNPGDIVGAIFRCTQVEENDFTVQAWFTPKESPTDAPTLGWQVTSFGNVYLTDDYPSPVVFDNLRFQYPSEVTTDSMLALLGQPAAGISAPVASGIVPAGSVANPGRLFISHESLGVGAFLTARLDTSFADPGFSTLNATVVIGHEHQSNDFVPTPTTPTTPPPVPGVVSPIGGIVELPYGAQEAAAAGASGSSDLSPGGIAAIAGAMSAALVAVGASGWYARRRFVRR